MTRSGPGQETTASRAAVPVALALPLAVLVASLFAAVGFVLHLAARESDEEALRRQGLLVAGVVDRSISEIVWQQESVTVWDQTIRNLVTPDPDWLDGNAGVWLNDYFGIDEVYILDAEGAPVYTMVDGARGVVADYAAVAGRVAPLVDKLRAAAAGGETTSLHEVLDLGGSPSIVGLSLVVSDSGMVEQAPGTEFVHVAVRHMDGASYLTDVATKALVASPRIVRDSGEAPGSGLHAVAGADGSTLAFLAWTPDRPGARLLRQALPVLGVAGLLLAAVVWLIAGRLWRTTSALRSSEAEARHLAFHDPLTGLANRARFNMDLEAALDRVFQGERAALIYVDLDRFKYVNDTFGHHAGDELIRQVARRLAAMVRAEDSVARLGGDEFAVIQADARDDADVAALCERILGRVAEPFSIGENTVYVGASIGVVVSPDEGVDGAELTRKADIALYGAKAAGRNSYRVFAPAMDEALHRRQTLEQDLRRTLSETCDLTVAYQPIVGRDRSLVGIEALVRWNHPTLGAIPPSEFVPVAEETGLIGEIGEIVLDKALPVAAAAGLPLSVNVSPVQLLTASFPARLIRMVTDAGIRPRDVELEITETVLIEGQDRTRQVLEGLRDAGFRIALDDFGTDYSSLAYLRTFPVDRIKIDRSFVSTLSSDPDAARIVEAVADLGRALGKSVTAEGVETEAQFAVLVAAGCDAFQGHLISPAVPAAEVLARARQGARAPAAAHLGRPRGVA